jgi:hypothetical protein
MIQQKLSCHPKNNNKTNIGKCYELEVRGGKKGTAILYHHGMETWIFDIRLAATARRHTRPVLKPQIPYRAVFMYGKGDNRLKLFMRLGVKEVF